MLRTCTLYTSRKVQLYSRLLEEVTLCRDFDLKSERKAQMVHYGDEASLLELVGRGGDARQSSNPIRGDIHERREECSGWHREVTLYYTALNCTGL